MTSSFPLLGSPSPDFIALCQAQVDILTEQMEADRCAIYLTQPRSSELIPIVVYPAVVPREEKPRSLNPAGEKTERLPPVKLEDIPTIWTGSDRDRLILPLMYEDQMVGLLVTGRDNRRWGNEELARVDKIARTLAIACLMDRRQQWYERRWNEERYRRTWERERLDVFLHQVRNPLTALKTFGKLLLKRLLPDDANSAAIAGILRESDRVRDLIAEFEADIDHEEPETVDIERIDGQDSPTAFLLPSIESELDSINPLEILDPLILSATEVARERGIRLETDFPDTISKVRANTAGLREVLSNLIDNALKYTPKGGCVEVSGREIADGVEIEVSDTGYGIPEEDRSNLFRRHYRGVQAKGEIPGTGLGLAIAKELIERMGGSIDFTSPNPRNSDDKYPGTVFRVRLQGESGDRSNG
ncbi:GAF domain-containing sensor histidine kinase [Pannus brasiliensis CCIBt3594]|uniref:histidine kinase n=1 Tax=Pannus brasiliensis CCIBt3594 TaxID=1427578 RepID=A0AAW9QQE7_9CHRO